MGRKSRLKWERRAAERARSQAPATLRQDLAWGLFCGLGLAAFTSLFVIAQSVLRGSFHYERYGVSAWPVLASYVAAGSVGGALLGLLRPLTHRRWGAAGVGMLVGTVAYGSAGIAMFGFGLRAVAVALPLGLVVGGAVGYRQWQPRVSPPA